MNNSPHSKMTSWVGGLGLIVVGVLWWLTRYDMIGANLWDWLLPLLVILCGVWHIAMCSCGCSKCKASKECGDCKDGSCRNDGQEEKQM